MKSLKEISDELRSYSAHLNEVNDQSLIEIKENITKNIDELIAGFEPISAEYNTMETLEQDAAVYSKCPLQQLKFFLDAIIATLEYSAQLVNESDYCHY